VVNLGREKARKLEGPEDQDHSPERIVAIMALLLLEYNSYTSLRNQRHVLFFLRIGRDHVEKFIGVTRQIWKL